MLRLVFLALCAIFSTHTAAAQTFSSEHYDLKLSVIADGLDHPWGLAFLPDGAMLVTERDPGTIRIVARDGTVQPPLSGTPMAFYRWPGGHARCRHRS